MRVRKQDRGPKASLPVASRTALEAVEALRTTTNKGERRQLAGRAGRAIARARADLAELEAQIPVLCGEVLPVRTPPTPEYQAPARRRDPVPPRCKVQLDLIADGKSTRLFARETPPRPAPSIWPAPLPPELVALGARLVTPEPAPPPPPRFVSHRAPGHAQWCACYDCLTPAQSATALSSPESGSPGTEPQ